ncbi:hypothetical protein C5167_018881 [Papaver somniferum]|uniref:protein-serine/threonine phosphatase n=1 Tax=Papaver somniferum TaxID=3469 RepID=A0A4Y7IRN1_PAPSO|nr:probable protein phosphatase 2C 42 isoform X2 [Papaver somniferum]XP_026447900.1 probable protein phosphatase 2C 42 isoform X2 [Papaver somniferum]RZC50460.1 hypothetical protein C5167_018881 [Papaver somniferum]
MLKSIKKLYSLYWKPLSVNPHSSSSSSDDGFSNSGGDGGKRDRDDKSLWYKDLGKCSSGDLSMAVVQANQVLEDQSQIESFGGDTTFVGVYDGHGGPDTTFVVGDNLYRHFREISEEARGVTSETIRRAFLETEQGYTAIVDQLWDTRPNLATVGSCCLLGVVIQQTLYVANLGDSRVVLGRKVGNTAGVAAIQLSSEHNANMEEVRQELRELHPDDPQLVVEKHGVWRVKGIIQVSRSIGDLYLKDNKYNTEQFLGKFRLPKHMQKPVLSADPAVMSLPLQPNNLFLIFASDGLWEHLSNEQAVEIVHRNPRAGSARILLKAALQEAARKKEMRYEDLRRIDKKVSSGSQKARVQDKKDICWIDEKDMREYHDDICRTKQISTGVAAIQLSSERNANMEELRRELTELQPDNTQVVGQKHRVWRVKSIIQILRLIGDLYVKDAKYHTRQIRRNFRQSVVVLFLLLLLLPTTVSLRSKIPVQDSCVSYLTSTGNQCLPFLISVIPNRQQIYWSHPPLRCCKILRAMQIKRSTVCLCYLVQDRFLLGGLEVNLTRLFSFDKRCTFRKSVSGASLQALCRRLSPGLRNLTTIQVKVPPPPLSVEGPPPPPPPPLNSKEDILGEILPYAVGSLLILYLCTYSCRRYWRSTIAIPDLNLDEV